VPNIGTTTNDLRIRSIGSQKRLEVGTGWICHYPPIGRSVATIAVLTIAVLTMSRRFRDRHFGSFLGSLASSFAASVPDLFVLGDRGIVQDDVQQSGE